jgi:hypothetical protein
MATNFPTSLDTLTNPSAADTLDSPPHDEQHADANDAIEALQAKVGVDSSAVTSSHDYKIADHASRLTTLEAISHGKILQVVRATDSTTRSTTSTSYVDASISVTITPTLATSTLLILWIASFRPSLIAGRLLEATITDSSNVALSGAEDMRIYAQTSGEYRDTPTLIGYSAPATTSAVTYKGRFKTSAGTANIENTEITGQMYALEVGA